MLYHCNSAASADDITAPLACSASPASDMLYHCNRAASADNITAPLACMYGAVHFLPHATPDDGNDYIF